MRKVKTISLIICSCFGVWLAPQLACIKNSGVYASTGQVNRTDTGAATQVPSSDTLSYLALGDSYTIGQSVAESDRYPVQAVALLNAGGVNCQAPLIIATTGWTTADLLNATPQTVPAQPYSIVTLLIGVNNQYQGRSQSEYREQFTTLVTRSILLAGNRPSHVIVLSIPDYSVTPFARGSNTAYISSQIDSFNAINKNVASSLRVGYLDVTGESRKAAYDPSLIAVDGLHFSGKEYAIWASMLAPMMKAAGK